MSVGRYQAYPKYKDSGLPWMTEVPAHWTEVRFKHVLADKKKTLRPDLPAGSISFGRVVYKDAEILSNETKAAYQEVLSGEFLVNPLNLNYDLMSLRTALSSIDVVVSTGYIVLQSSGRLNPNYTRWLLQQFDVAHMKTLGAGVRQTINFADIGNSFFFEPSLSEQTQIAAFLDYETAKIDRLIEKQQALISLLKEKRQAVISHAVTKGLNPHAPLKDSGIEWLGQVPAHWSVSKIKHVAEVESGHTPDKKIDAYWVNCDIPWVSLNDSTQLKQVDYITDTAFYLNEKGIANSSARKLPPRAVIFTRDASIGLSAITTREMAVSQHVIAWICNPEKVLPEYLLLVFYAMAEELERYTFGATIKTIGMSDVNTLVAAFPSVAEQKKIADHIFALKDKLFDAVTRAEKLVQILQERRTALISAAVTGKIDVRHWQPSEN